MPDFKIRLLHPDDSLHELTELLHRSYQRLADMGFNYTATNQSVEVTRERIEGNECYVALANGRIVGTALLILGRLENPAWANQPGVAYAGQLGVEPESRHLGLGARLMQTIEDRARELGYHTIAGDTSEGADYLIRFYTGRGFEQVGFHHWGGKTYRSAILAKRL
ncbi:MAG: GNAT family N-acetyltransferase [Planctomycetes bacterium]|nr:GNAT family N-acetyltransferase [Planctomycetota bacterium]